MGQAQRIGAAHVAHVEEVALRLEVAGPQHRLLPAGADQRDLPREGRDGEVRRLPGPGVVERAQPDRVQPVRRHRRHRQVGGGLGGAIGVHRRQQGVLVQRLAAPERGAIGVGARHEQEGCRRRVRAYRAREVERAVEVDRPGAVRLGVGDGNGGDRGEVQTKVGLRATHRFGHGRAVRDVAVERQQHRVRHQRRHRRRQVPAGEATEAGDEDAPPAHGDRVMVPGSWRLAPWRGAAQRVVDGTARWRARSASTISAIMSSRPVSACQPSLVRALDGSPSSTSTSAGRIRSERVTTWSS